MPLRTIDLCAGIGGIRKGFEMTGHFENVLSAEIDRYACITYEHLYGENPLNDLTSAEFKDRVDELEYEVLLAGFPCQTFSRAGLEEGFNDEAKGIIFNHIAEIIERTRPRGIFLENVDNLIRHDNGNTMRTIINRLELDLNYKVIGVTFDENGQPLYDGRNFVRNSKRFGVPQNRPRRMEIGIEMIIASTIPGIPTICQSATRISPISPAMAPSVIPKFRPIPAMIGIRRDRIRNAFLPIRVTISLIR